jgi:F-type H+-transporting ATPase subunit b
MKRFLPLIFAAGLVLAGPAAFAQEPASEHPGANATEEKGAHEQNSEGGEGGLQGWKWLNFAILAGGLGYLAVKMGGPFFATRSAQIRKDLVEAGELHKQAEARAAEVDRRLANLETEVASLREEAARESQAERERVAAQTEAELAKIKEQSEQEIVAAGKAARNDLRRYAAHLAVELAEKQIRSQMTPAAQSALVEDFVRDLDPPASEAQAN